MDLHGANLRAHTPRPQQAAVASMREQLDKVAHMSVLITPCGGVSMILPFLPDAHAAAVTPLPCLLPIHSKRLAVINATNILFGPWREFLQRLPK